MLISDVESEQGPLHRWRLLLLFVFIIVIMKVSAYVFDAESAMITVHPCKQVSATIIATSPAPQTSVLSNQKLIVLDTRVQFRTHDLPTSW